MLNYGTLMGQVERDELSQFHSTIKSIPGFRGVTDDLSKWPQIKIADVLQNAPESTTLFKSAVKDFGNRIKSLSKSQHRNFRHVGELGEQERD